MKAKRYLVASGAVLALALAGCGGSTGSSSAGGTASSGSGDCSSTTVFCVGLVTDLGKIDDKSFNQSAWEGVQKAGSDLGAQTKYIETVATTDYANNIKQFLDAKYDVIVTVGFNMAQATVDAAKANPNTTFIGVDQDQSAGTVPNLAGLVFPEDQAGYAAGYLAGLLTKTNKIGQVLGMQIPPVERYAKGYEAGAKASNPKVTVTTVYHPAGDNAFSDPVWGANEAKNQLNQGADVIFGAGGNTGNGALGQIAKATGAGTSVYCIGVDTDQWDTVPQAQPCLVTSAEKMITDGVFTLLQKAKDGSIQGGNFLGTTGIAPYHDFASKIPQDIQDKVAAVVKGLADGSIKTGVVVK